MGKKILEDLTGKAVDGFRAPIFSLTPQSLWAIDVLSDLGFVYSSSVLPARNPLYGFPGAPETPFRWPNGLVELPVPIARLGPFAVPYLGGIYLRYLPSSVIRRCLSGGADAACLWIYCHPYDFDPGEAFFRFKGASWTTSALLWLNRRGTFEKMRQFMGSGTEGFCAPPFAVQVRAGDFEAVPIFDPYPGKEKSGT